MFPQIIWNNGTYMIPRQDLYQMNQTIDGQSLQFQHANQLIYPYPQVVGNQIQYNQMQPFQNQASYVSQSSQPLLAHNNNIPSMQSSIDFNSSLHHQKSFEFSNQQQQSQSQIRTESTLPSKNIIDREEEDNNNVPQLQQKQVSQNYQSTPYAKIKEISTSHSQNQIQIIYSTQYDQNYENLEISCSTKKQSCEKQYQSRMNLEKRGTISSSTFQLLQNGESTKNIEKESLSKYEELEKIELKPQILKVNLEVQIKQELLDAFKQTEESIFNQDTDVIFSNKYIEQFHLKESHQQNDEIVFSKRKEYRNQGNGKKYSTLDNEERAQIGKSNSKFHNLNKLFMYKLLATLTIRNLIELKAPAYLYEILPKIIQRIKQSTKQMKNYNKKTEFFSHDHYNLLFLHLNENTLSYLLTSPFAVYLHLFCFDLDLKLLAQKTKTNTRSSESVSTFKISPDALQEFRQKIQYVNIIKRFCSQIVLSSNMFGECQKIESGEIANSKNLSSNSLQEELDLKCETPKSSKQLDSSQQSDIPNDFSEEKEKIQNLTQNEKMRQAYTERALKGIKCLNQGIIIRRF